MRNYSKHKYIYQIQIVFRHFCCCLDLRDGAIAIAVLEMLIGLGSFGSFANGFNWIAISIFLPNVASGISLLYGAIKHNSTAVLVNLILSLVGVVFLIVMSLLTLIPGASMTLIEQRGDQIIMLVLGSIYLLITLIQIYFWICVYSYFRKLKSGNLS